MKTELNGINIDYRDEGAGLPVIFLHAFPLNQTMWDDQVTALRNHCRVVTLDLRGFGHSDAPQGPYKMDQMAADVRALMTILNLDKVVLVGLSMGGYIALALYRNYPETLRALVLADTRASGDTQEARRRRLKSAERAELDGSTAIARDMVPLLLGLSTIENRPSVVKRVQAMIESNTPQGIAGAQRGMAERRDSTYILAGIDFPVLIVVGSEDTLTPVADAESLRNGIPGARMCVIESAGHLSNLERPDAFNTALDQFVERLKTGQ
jgi:pimeloyl-ACP methyl ester carboxylesterase